MMSLCEMHSMVTRVHIAIEVGLITAYVKVTHVLKKKSCTMHRERKLGQSVQNAAHPLSHQQHP